MRIVIAGGSGFLGRHLAAHLAARGDDVVVLTRRASGQAVKGIREVEWAADGHPGAWSAEIDGAGAVINLAGAGLADKRWSQKRKAELRHSRVMSTRSLVASMRKAAVKPEVLIQGSAIGFYGVAPQPTFDESCPPGSDVLGDLCVAWEAEAHPASALGVRTVFIRTGIVLHNDGGALPRMTTPFKWFVGGPMASGRQVMSWIHLDDWMALVTWAIETKTAEGVYNASAPVPVTNAEFAKALGKAVHRPSWLPVPAFALRVIVGEFAPLGLVQGQRVIPKRALEAGFKFKYPTIGEAMPAAITPS